MGEVISLRPRIPSRRRVQTAHMRAIPPPITFAFEPSSPWTYLTAERIDARFAAVHWLPVDGTRFGAVPACADRRERARVERRAFELGLPLVWPPTGAGDGAGVRRVATLAAECDRSAQFALAAGRLAHCGGYDLGEPDVLAEAAAAAGLDPADALEAACDPARDRTAVVAAARFARRGATTLPALQVGRTLFCGEAGVAQAGALIAARAAGARVGSRA
jgi:2-hydroxychromene-2-carboxylate isomerase